MACECKIISLGKTNKFLFLILVGAVLLTSLTFIESLTKFFAEENKHPVIYSMTYSIGLSLSFILVIISKIRSKRKNKNSNILLNAQNEPHTLSIIHPSHIVSFKEKFLWILLTSGINYFAYIFFCIYWVNYDTYLNLWGVTLPVMSLFSHFILKIKLYKHHYLAIFIVVIFGFSYNIVTHKFSKENIKHYDSYLVEFMTECLISLMNVMYKYLMDKKYIISYEILFIEGLIEFILGIITLIITTNIGAIDNFWDFIDQIDTSEIIFLIVLTLIQFLLYLVEIIIIDMFSPFHILLINIIREYIIFFIFFDRNELTTSIYCTLGICFCIFMFLVFTEIIELNFLGLSKMTKKNIELRAQTDSMNNYDDNKSERIESKGYIFDLKDDESKEMKELKDSEKDSSIGN